MSTQKEINLALRLSRKGQPKVKRPPGFPQVKDKASKAFIKSLNPKLIKKKKRALRKSHFEKDQFISCLTSLGEICLSGSEESSAGQLQGPSIGTAALGLGAAAGVGLAGYGVYTATRNLNDIIENAVGDAVAAANGVAETIGAVREPVERVAAAVAQVAEDGLNVNHRVGDGVLGGIMSPIITFIRDKIGSIASDDQVKVVMKLLAILGVIYAFYEGGTVLVVGSSAFFLAAFGPSAISAFLDLMEAFRIAENAGLPESDDGEEVLEHSVATTAISFLVKHFSDLAGLTTSPSGLRKFLKDAAVLSRDIKSLKDMYSLVSDYACRLFRTMYRVMMGKECEIALFLNAPAVVYTELNRFVEINAQFNGQEIDVYNYIAQLADNLAQLRHVAHMCEPNTPERNEVNNTITRASGLLMATKASIGSGSHIRQEPVGVIFAGPPKCGKTVATTLLSRLFAFALAAKAQKERWIKEPGAIANGIWNENLTSKYADGHEGQNVHVIDEVTNEPVGDDYPLSAKILKYINTAPLPLTRAQIEKKGNDYYHAKLLIGTTNNCQWKAPVGVVEPGAFYRRIHFFYCSVLPGHGVPERGYMVLSDDEQLHMQRSQARFNSGEIDVNQYIAEAFRGIRFHRQPMSRNNGQIAANPADSFTFEELIPFIRSEIAKKKAWFKANQITNEKLVGNITTLFADMDNDDIADDSEDVEEQEQGAPPPPIGELAGVAQSMTLDACKDVYDWLRRKMLSRKNNSVPLEELREETGLPILGVARTHAHLEAIRDSNQSHNSIVLVSAQVGQSRSTPLNAERPFGEGNIEDLFVAGVDEFARRFSLGQSGAANQIGAREAWQSLIPHMHLIRNLRVDEDFHMALARSIGLVSTLHNSQSHRLFEEFQEVAVFAMYFTLTRPDQPFLRTRSYTMSHFETACMIVAGSTLASVALNAAVNYFAPFLGGAMRLQSNAPIKKKKERKAAVSSGERLVLQGSENVDPIGQVIMNATYRFTVTGTFPGTTLSSCFVMVQNHMALFSNHVIKQLDEAHDHQPDAIMTIMGARTYEFPLSNLFDSNRKRVTADGTEYICFKSYIPYPGGFDAALLYMPVNGKAISNHFASNSKVRTFYNDREVSMLSRTLNGAELRSIGVSKYVSNPETSARVMDRDGDFRQIGEHVLEYNLSTRAGDCGSPIVARVDGNYKIVGIHTSGMNGRARLGQCIMIDMECIKDMIEKMSNHLNNSGTTMVVEDVVLTPESSLGYELMCPSGSDKESVCDNHVIAKVKRPSLASKTSIVKSPIHDLVEAIEERAPARLSSFEDDDGEFVDVFDVAMTGYGLNEVAPSEELMESVGFCLIQDTLRFPVLPHEITKFKNWEEVVVPPNHLEFVSKVERNTSSGYPLVLMGEKGKKKTIFGNKDEYEFTSKQWGELVVFLDRCEAKMLKGKRPQLYSMSFLKDERRPILKAKKPRMVSAASLPAVMLLRKYTLGLVNYLVRNRIKNDFAVGVNPFQEWTWLAAHLGIVHPPELDFPTAIAGDFSKFDKKIIFQFWNLFSKMCDYFYNDENTDERKIRQFLFYDLAHSRHVFKDVIIEWLGSNSSGNFLTTFINCFVNALKTKMALVRVCIDHEATEKHVIAVHSAANYAKVYASLFRTGLVRLIFYGDDGLIRWARGRVVPSWFSIDELSRSLKLLFGDTYTDDCKTLDSVGAKPLSECTFLKRGFAYNALSIGHSQEVSCPLVLASIVDSVRWTKKHDETLQFWRQTVDTAMRELCLHEPGVYKTYGDIICGAMREAGFPMILPPQLMVQEIVRGQDVFI